MRQTGAVSAIRAGRRYGQWVITGKKPLGSGGNGQVWRVEADGKLGAIKILSAGGGPGGRYRLGRFLDEIAFLRAHPATHGILPLLDSRISDNQKETSWYVMPVARPIRQALGADPEPAVVVGAVAAIASTLASLADEGVAHRDIKPDNLFELDGRWVIGDFGLVTYPDKDPRTEHGRRLGPLDYMAPEMRRDADQADPGPADVWALAKTLWVLLAGAELPLPGTHQPAEGAYALRERITFGFAAELDLLLEKATMTEPQDRVSMAGMASELRACVTSPPETRAQASLAELSARAGALTAASRLPLAGQRLPGGRTARTPSVHAA
jgi:serine/threonine protein kinase